MTKQKPIHFSPPVITEQDIKEVVRVLKSGWITTGKKVKEFEQMLASYIKVPEVLCLNSATAGLEILLRALGIGPGDEVITTPYTFTATASVIHHVGAKIVFADVIPDTFFISPEEIKKKITHRTKAVIAVDIAGLPCDYSKIKQILNSKKKLYHPETGTLQMAFSKPVLIADSSHSFGAVCKNKVSGTWADCSVFSFHAVKNITTAEGGAIAFQKAKTLFQKKLISTCRLFSLHGQTKHAFQKETAGWRYDISVLGYKFNMTDIQAALGISQLKRYQTILTGRKKIFERYLVHFLNDKRFIVPAYNHKTIQNAYHLFPLRIKKFEEIDRDLLISLMKSENIATNVHFVPLPMFTAYKKLGYNISDYPDTYNTYKNLITLPLHLKLSLKDVDRVAFHIKKFVAGK